MQFNIKINIMANATTQTDITDDQQTVAPNESDKDTLAGQTDDTDISPTELELLDNAGTNEPGDDDDLLNDSQLDNLDEEGEELNEADDLTGEDLDVPGSEADDFNESLGEEDEENNSFSMRDQDDVDDGDPIL